MTNKTVSVFEEQDKEFMFFPGPHRSGVKTIVRCRVYPGKSGKRPGTIYEPISEGTRWHMGIPEVCWHPFERTKWADDFYPSVSGISDHGTCLDCGASRWRVIEYV